MTNYNNKSYSIFSNFLLSQVAKSLLTPSRSDSLELICLLRESTVLFNSLNLDASKYIPLSHLTQGYIYLI